ncbi:MAG: antiterminator LoaP [Oliverpabstia sp.]|nr:antiterminator LoaP [Oliverpabstia sp.]
MWYVIQVHTGTEENVCQQCEKVMDSSVLEGCFIPRFQKKKRFLGEWHMQNEILFPGYVFLVTEQLDELVDSLKQVNGMAKLLKTGDEITPLSQQEVALLKKMGNEKQEVEMSIGVIEGDKVHIFEGPLQGMEGLIRKIDRHKRMAYLEVEMFGRMVEMRAGLEIIEKITADQE